MWIIRKTFFKWLTRNIDLKRESPLSNFERIQYEVKLADVLLIEGRSRVSRIIRTITQSPWTHAVLYIGRLHDIEDKHLRAKILEHYPNVSDQQLIIESDLEEGTIVTPLAKYQDEHIRICRPRGLLPQDAQKVIAYAIHRLGVDYDVRQILDLARFLFPWGWLPRRWRSSLFEHNAGKPTRQICSSLIAEAFDSVHYPILPVIRHKQDEKKFELFPRNPRLYTPSDFDYSPYFDIIKYPFLELDELLSYRALPWNQDFISNDAGELVKVASATEHDASE